MRGIPYRQGLIKPHFEPQVPMTRAFAAPVVGLALFASAFTIPVAPSAPAPREQKQSSWPMLGGTPSRNNINLTDRNIPDNFDPEKDDGILWTSALGSRSFTQPIIAGGKIFVGTNNERPRNQRDVDMMGDPVDRGVLMCFDQRTGKFLWQAVHNKLPSGVNDWEKEGIASSPAVEGNRVYYVSNRAEVVCANANGRTGKIQGKPLEYLNFATKKLVSYDDEFDADIIWSLDMVKELNVFPHNLAVCPPLVVGDIVFVVTANGVDESHIKVPSPEAPSFIALDKNTGKLLWKDNSPGKNIMHGQWGIPSYTAEPVPMVMFPGGDGWLRAFDPPTGKLLWKFDGNPKNSLYELGGTGTRNDFVTVAPVVAGGRVFIGVGQDPEHSTGIGHLWCIDLAKAVEFGAKNKNRDVSPVDDNFDPKAEVNKNSALAWHFGGEDNRQWAPRDFKFGRTLSCACVVDEVLYIGELAGYVHCFDARTGKRYWVYDTKASIWSSPYYVDGKIYFGNDNGDLYIFKHMAKPDDLPDPDEVAQNAPNMKAARAIRRDVRKKIEEYILIHKAELDAPIRTTVSVAGGVLYVNTEKTLYAIARR
jgi:outer membrane protein assembly factor BamB